MQTKITTSLLLIVLMAALISACTLAPDATANDKPKILATTSFLADIAQNVAGERVQVARLLPEGADPHEYQPTPQDAIKLAEAEVLIVNGVGYEVWLEDLLASAQRAPIVIVAAEGLTPRRAADADHAEADPHLWLNPLNAARYAENIRAGLTEYDPAGEAVFAANARVYITRLNDLDQWIKAEVAQIPVEKRLLVTNHDALGYFAEAYGFTIVGAVLPGLSSESAPTGAQLAELIDAIKRTNAPAIFIDAGANEKLAEQIAAETEVRVVTGIYIETLSPADGPAPTYIDMLKHDVSLIVGALK